MAFFGSMRDEPDISLCPMCKTIMRGSTCNICRYQRTSAVTQLTVAEYLSHYAGAPAHDAEMTNDLQTNAIEIVKRTNCLLDALSCVLPGLRVQITSGWRPAAYNASIGGSPNSWHCQGLAVDLLDPEHRIGLFLRQNPQFLEANGLWMEQLEYCEKPTGFWVHLQARPPKSGTREFQPYPGAPKKS